MCVLKLPIRTGARVRTHASYQYPLPGGLPAGVEVDVVSAHPDYTFTVRDLHGRAWEITSQLNLDAGELFDVGGEWLSANDGRVVALRDR